jgi:phage gp16-like protein
MKASTINNNKKSLIHVAKARCGMSDGDYHAMLSGFGVSSSKDLTDNDFDAVMAHFAKLGFKSNKSAKRYGGPPSSKKKLMAKIEAIRAGMNLTEAYIDGMARHMFKNDDGEPVASYRWLNADQLRRVVAALTYHKKRVQGVEDSRGQGGKEKTK